MHRRLALSTLALTTALMAGMVASAFAQGTHTGVIESVQMTEIGGFVHNEASFRESGAGSSQVSVWIEVWAGKGGPLKDTLGRKAGTIACQAGKSCFSLLRTLAQTLKGECYVGWASITTDGRTQTRSSPASGRLCP